MALTPIDQQSITPINTRNPQQNKSLLVEKRMTSASERFNQFLHHSNLHAAKYIATPQSKGLKVLFILLFIGCLAVYISFSVSAVKKYFNRQFSQNHNLILDYDLKYPAITICFMPEPLRYDERFKQ
ncbi:unnamed protein product, partial [Didymodactylos carnosus]